MPGEADRALAAGRVMDECHALTCGGRRYDFVSEYRSRGRVTDLLDVRTAEPAGEDPNRLTWSVRFGDVDEFRLSLRP